MDVYIFRDREMHALCVHTWSSCGRENHEGEDEKSEEEEEGNSLLTIHSNLKP